MDGYYDVVDGAVVWRPYRDSVVDILPHEIQAHGAIFEVVPAREPDHTGGVRLSDLGRSGTAQGSTDEEVQVLPRRTSLPAKNQEAVA